MALPIDPTALGDEDVGEKRATLHMDHEEAIEHVREAFADAGIGVITEYSISDLIAEKIGSDRNPYCVLGACNPAMADRALDVSGKRIGALTPCNVVIWEKEPGVQTVYHASIMRIARLVGMAPDDGEMADVVAATSELVEEAFANLDVAA